MLLPEPRGPITQQLQAVGGVDRDKIAAFLDDVDESVLESDDVQLALWQLYEMHYQGFEDVDPRAEWDPDLIAVRGMLERRFEAELRTLTSPSVKAALSRNASIADRLFRLVANDDGPRLAAFVQRDITADQFRELLMHRSVYHLKEADPHTFAVPRLTGRAKAALIEIQFDEYGAGRPDDMHSVLFASTMRACGLDDTYGAYVDTVPGYTLASSNAMSMFGLNRRLRASAAGHLAAFEATSSLPNRRYAAGVRRLGYDDEAARYFDEHVEADAVHEQVAAREMCGALVADDPHCAEDILFGAATCLALDGLAGRQQLAAWAAGVSSLRPGVGDEPPE
jgi:Iron-containing redox enzyme